MNTFLILIKIYLPLLLLVIIPIIIFRIKRVSDKEINVDIFSFFQIPIPFNINFPIRGVYLKWILFFISFFSIVFYYINLDFSKFFPKEIEMTVHFNENQGIDRLLNEIELTEINGMKIVNDTAEINKFFHESDFTIKKYMNYNNFYSNAIITNENVLETVGKTNFIVEKVGGVQNYRIVKSAGELKHVKQIKDNSPEIMFTKFEKVVSQNDKISINKLNEIFDKIIIAPKFSQSLVIDGKGEEKLEQYLYGVTVINSFPYPTFSSTLYLYQLKDRLIPIGYAEYYQPKE